MVTILDVQALVVRYFLGGGRDKIISPIHYPRKRKREGEKERGKKKGEGKDKVRDGIA